MVETCLVPVSLNQIPDVMPQASAAASVGLDIEMLRFCVVTSAF